MTVLWPKEQVFALLDRRDVRPHNLLRIVEVGSTAHGISIQTAHDDLDYTVVRIEPFEELVLGPEDRQSMMIRTQPDGVRSRMGDIDLNVYTLRKFANLAAKGNPSILVALFSPRVWHSNGGDFETLGRIVASQRAGNAFLGYMHQQIERWTGDRGQKGVQRPELVEAYGYDTKYAAHIIRLGHQGIEYMQTGKLTLPLPIDVADEIIKLRTGGYPEADALAWAADMESDLKLAIAKSPLPKESGNVRSYLVENYRRWLT